MRVLRLGSTANAPGRVVHRVLSGLAVLTTEAAVVCVCVLLASTLASAQGTSAIAGVVRDSSGGVLPGVTVEASSPALIEKVRVVTTDGVGAYRISDLPPGVYTTTFSLVGLSTV